MIVFKNICKHVDGKPVFNNVSFIAQDGHVTLITGPSKSGKSLLIDMLYGNIPPDEGNIEIDGHLIAEVANNIEDYVYFVTQSVENSDHWDIIKDHHDKVSKGDLTDGTDIKKILKVLDPASRHFSESGQAYRKRVALAAAIISNKPNIILDDPLIDLNPNWRQAVINLLRHEADRGRTVIVTSTDTSEWVNCSDQVLYISDLKLNQGRLNTRLQTGDPVYIRAELTSNAAEVVKTLMDAGYTQVRSSQNEIVAQGFPGEMVDILSLIRDYGAEVKKLDVTTTPPVHFASSFGYSKPDSQPNHPSRSKFRYWMDSAK